MRPWASPRPARRSGFTVIPLTRRPGGIQAYKVIYPHAPSDQQRRRPTRRAAHPLRRPGRTRPPVTLTDAARLNPLRRAPAGYERIAEEGTSTSVDSLSLTAECTGDKVLLGGGGQIDGRAGQVVVDDLRNRNDDFTIAAYEDDNATFNTWHLHAYAMCADE